MFHPAILSCRVSLCVAGNAVPNLMGMAGGGPGYGGGYSPNLSDKYGQLGYMTDTMIKVRALSR